MGAQLVATGGLRVGVWLHGSFDPTAEEWSASCRTIADFAKDNDRDLSGFRVLIVTDGGTPDARQRQELFRDTLRGEPVKTAVITEATATDAYKRGIATALGWMNPNFRVFDPSDLFVALDFLDLPSSRFESVWSCLAVLESSLEPNATLRRIATLNRLRPSIPVPRSVSQPPRASGVLRAVRAHKSDSGDVSREASEGPRAAGTRGSDRARK
jgi:hypothetical protein